MTLIATTDALAALCQQWAQEPFVTVDTEFMREKTYYSQLCLVQVAGERDAVAIDPLADKLSLEPLLELMANPQVTKVFHAARQDLEIFYQLMGRLPEPIFDSQVAAMICGYGEQVGYDRLVSKFCKTSIDKGSRFTDWARRPLSNKQLDYALSDVTYLRQVYDGLQQELAQRGRSSWVDDEMIVLRDEATYRIDPEEVWRRLKPRNDRPRFLAILRELAATRERFAMERNLPRARVLRDETLLDIAAQLPQSPEDLVASRGVSAGIAHGKLGQELLAAIVTGQARAESDPPQLPPRSSAEAGGPLLDLLKVLLKARADKAQVAARMLAMNEDLEQLVLGRRDLPLLEGWRFDPFGREALALIAGELALTVRGKRVEVVPLPIQT